MDLHVIGGFLGSGKTTAIINAAKILQEKGMAIGVITNDKGHHLVDTAFLQSADIMVAEVAGGCFRCNDNDFRRCIKQLEDNHHPDMIFAESVGSCVDLVGPVLTPLSSMGDGHKRRVTYSVFTDIRLLERFLHGALLPFSDNISYIFKKQIEESAVLVINKIDLRPKTANEILKIATKRYPNKAIILQNSLTPDGIVPWLHILQQGYALPASIGVNYTPYVTGAAELAWFDEQLVILTPGSQGKAIVAHLLKTIHTAIQQSQKPIAHLKVLIRDAVTSVKVSLTTLDSQIFNQDLPDFQSGSIEILINARVQMEAEQLNNIMQHAIDTVFTAYNVPYQKGHATAFAPRVPEKTTGS